MKYTADNIIGIKFKAKPLRHMVYEISRHTQSANPCIVVTWTDIFERETVYALEDALHYLETGVWMPINHIQ
jgi:hypothetical protein